MTKKTLLFHVNDDSYFKDLYAKNYQWRIQGGRGLEYLRQTFKS